MGSPVDIDVRFDVLDTMPDAQEDYQVLLHVLDTSGELLWAMEDGTQHHHCEGGS